MMTNPEALQRCVREHLYELQKRNIGSANILAVFQQYCYVPKHTVREQLVQRISYVHADFLFSACYIGCKVGFVR
jgi:hypothetical protein